MDKLMHLAISRLSDQVEKLESEVKELRSEVARLKTTQPNTNTNQSQNPVLSDTDKNVLLDTREVMTILGISFNTLAKLVEQGLIKRIRINQRRIRFAKSAITDYIRLQSAS